MEMKEVFDMVPAWPLCITITVLLLYWYLTSNHNYWKFKGVPYCPALPIMGSLARAFSKPLHEVEMKRYKDKGRIYGYYEGNKAVIHIGDPDVLRDIFVKDFQFFTSRRAFSTNPLTDKMVQNLQGEDWKRVRSILTPAFTTGKMRKMITLFKDSAKTLINNYKAAANDGRPVDVKRFFGAFTMDVIASSAFGTKIDSHNNPENPFVSHARLVFARTIPWRVVLFFLFPTLAKLLGIDVFSPGALEFFRGVTLKIIEERKKKGQKRNDLLQLLIDSMDGCLEKEEHVPHGEDATEEMGHEEGNDQIFKSHHSSKTLSTEEVVAQCIIFFLAGYDTTASTLSFTAYELALNPDIQEQLIQEIDETIRQKGEISYDAVSGMKFLDKVISETLRKYPSAVKTERIADEDYEIKNHKITVPKGMVVGTSIYSIHHDPEYYPDPEKYDPNRFDQEQKSSRHPYTYLPFGAGPRNCVGMRFALLEIKVCLAYVLSQCRFSVCSETKVPLEFYSGQALMQPKQVMLKVQLREDADKM